MSNATLYHHGVKGMKWGVRRYQNKDGSLTAEGRKKNLLSGKDDTISYKHNKTGESGWKGLGRAVVANKGKIARAGIAAATVTAAALYVHKNPEAIGRVVSKFRGMKMSDVSQKVVDKGKEYAKNAVKSAKEGVNEAVKEAPKKAAKAVVTGVVMNQTKKALDSAVGKEESAKIFQANDNKKIGKFWKTSPEDKDDDQIRLVNFF